MRQWKKVKRDIEYRSMLNLPLTDKQKSVLRHRSLKVIDGKMIPMTKQEAFELMYIK
jgi:hypothetical protein